MTSYFDEANNMILYKPNWYKLKGFLLKVFILIVLAFLIIVPASCRLYAKKKVQQSVIRMSQMLCQYFMGDKDASEIFPKEYAETAIQMAGIKSTMQRHEQILKEETTRKNDLITYLAHDLKTPLTSIIGYLTLLTEAPDIPMQQRAKYTNIALDKAYRLEQLINEFFDITRYNLQQIDLEKETIDLYYMLVQMTDEFYPLLTSHKNTITLQSDENISIYGDSIKLARVFNNILKNAIAYSYPNTVIEVWTEYTPEITQIYFRNKGKTIPEQKLNAIFEKFFRVDESRTTNTGGAGLGLAIAKEIITLHQGSITVKSENELTTFCVSLPSL